MTKLATIVLSSMLSIAGVALLGPRLGLFQWAELGASEDAAPEVPAKASPAETPRRASAKPDWVDESLAALKSDIAQVEREIAAARDDIGRYREELAEARADQEDQHSRRQEQLAREEQRRARENTAARARQRSRSRSDSRPESKLTASGCRWEFSGNGTMTFRFTVRNPGSEYASAQAAVYLVEQDYLTGANRSLVETVPVEVAPRSSQRFSQTWTVIEPDDEFATCAVEIER